MYETLTVTTQQVTSEYQEPQKPKHQHAGEKSDDAGSDKKSNFNHKKFIITTVLFMVILSVMTIIALVLAAVSYNQSESSKEINLLSSQINQLKIATESNLSQALTQLRNATRDNIRLTNDINLLKDQFSWLTAVTQHNISDVIDQITITNREKRHQHIKQPTQCVNCYNSEECIPNFRSAQQHQSQIR